MMTTITADAFTIPLDFLAKKNFFAKIVIVFIYKNSKIKKYTYF